MKSSFGASITILLLLRGTEQCFDNEVTVDLIDAASLPARYLEQATRSAGRILLTTGTTIYWRRYPGDLPSSFTGSRAVSPSYDLRLRIASQAPGSLPSRTLAYSLPLVRTGTSVTIFYDRVKRVSKEVEIDSPSILGLVIAHEIGHILLRSTKHSSNGIMRSPWTKSDIQHAAARLAAFTSEERNLIRHCAVPEMFSKVDPAKPPHPPRESFFAPE